MSMNHELISLLDRAVLKIDFINTKPVSIDLPQIDGLQIDELASSQQTTIINGNITRTVTHNYLVTPSKVGDYTIGPVHIKYTGGEKDLSTHLKVIKKATDPESQKISELVFSRVALTSPSPYVYEPFDLAYKIYIRNGVQAALTDAFGRSMISVQGGMPEKGLDGSPDWDFQKQGQEEYKGHIYNTYTFKISAKALTSGDFTFQPRVQIQVVIPSQNRRPFGMNDPFFGDMFGRQETRPLTLDCNKLDVQVRAIPTKGRPASYTGGVGVMDFDVAVSPAHVKAGEPVTIKMRITGQGNLDKIVPAGVTNSPGLKLYDIQTTPTDNTNAAQYEQVVIPTSDSVKQVPAISFSYFNTKTADFRTIKKGPFPITVDPAPHQAAQVIASAPVASQRSTKVLGHDIAYLKPRPKEWKKTGEPPFYRTVPFRVMMVLPALLLAITGMVSTRRNRLANNVALARRQKAPKAARQNIQLAEQALRKKDDTAFYEAMWNALAEYFGHRLNLAPGQVTLHTVLARMPGDEDAIEQLFNTIEQRRYGIQPSEGHPDEEMKTLLDQLVATLKKCERMKL